MIYHVFFIVALVFVTVFLARPISLNAVKAAKLLEAQALSETANKTALPGSLIIVYTVAPLSVRDGKIEEIYAVNVTGSVGPATCFKLFAGRISGCGAWRRP